MTLVEVSGTNAESYDSVKTFRLVKSKISKMVLLATLISFSDLTKTSFSNFIACEAYYITADSSPITLRSFCYSKPCDFPPFTLSSSSQMIYNFNLPQLPNYGVQSIGMLTGVSLQNVE